MFVYTIQPVIKPVWQPCWTNSHYSFNCQTRFDNHVERTVLFVQPVVKLGCTSYNRFDNRVEQQPLFLQPVVKRVWQPVECMYIRYNRLSNRFDNRLYRLNGISIDSAIFAWLTSVTDRSTHRPTDRQTTLLGRIYKVNLLNSIHHVVTLRLCSLKLSQSIFIDKMPFFSIVQLMPSKNWTSLQWYRSIM